MTSEPNANYVGYNIVSQLSGCNSNQMALNLQAQPYTHDHATHVLPHDNVNITFTNTGSPGQMLINSQTQPYAQDFRSHTTSLPLHGNINVTSTNADSPDQMAINLQTQHFPQTFRSHTTSLPLHGNVRINTMHHGNTGNRITLSPPIPCYGPFPDVDISISEQLNTPNCNKVETQKKDSCPLCGSSNGNFGTIKSITHTFTQMRTQADVLNEPEYVITREVRIELVIGRVPANARFSQVLALTQQ